MTSRSRTWWRNLRKGARVSLLVNGSTLNGFARADLDEASVRSHLVEYIRHIPMAARSLGIRMEGGLPSEGMSGGQPRAVVRPD